MKMIKLSFFALLFMMSGALSAATLTVNSVAGGTNNFASTGGVIVGSGSNLVTVDSGTINGTFAHHFNVANSGSLTFRLHVGATATNSRSSINDFQVLLNGTNIITFMSPGLYAVNPIYNALLLSTGQAVAMIVKGDFGSNTTYDVTLSTPIPAAVWLFGSALMGIIGFTRRKSVVAS